MTVPWKAAIWNQFGAAIDMLQDNIRECPPDAWQDRLWPPPASHLKSAGFQFEEFSEYWYLAYHTLFWLDLYLTGAEEGFVPPAPFALIEQDASGPLPERVYTQAELLDYLQHCRQQCQATIMGLTDEAAARVCTFGWGQVTYIELLLYTMRHVQGHGAQLNLWLGQRTAGGPDWQATARNNPA